MQIRKKGGWNFNCPLYMTYGNTLIYKSRFCKPFIRDAQNQNIWMPNNLKAFRKNKTEGPKRNRQKRVMLPMSEKVEPSF